VTPAGEGPDGTLPPARDPRMDRPASSAVGDWQVLLVPREAGADVRRVRLSARELRAWRAVAGAAVVALVVTIVALGFSWPRSAAYGELVRENLELKRRLDDIDEKMGEVDRILLRLRVYDAQLDSVAGPKGDHGGPGGLPEEVLANHLPADLPDGADLEALWDEVPLDAIGSDDPEDEGSRPATAWAAEIEQRLDGFLEGISAVEPDVNRILGDLEAVRALQGALPHVWPAEGLLTSGYGFRRNPFGGRGWRHHSGVDIGGQRGYAIYAAAAGTVRSAKWDGGLGRAIRLDHGYGLGTVYGHMSRLLVKEGDHVEAGQRIGLMGTTGHSTGPHLHFEVHVDGHPTDPFDYVEVPPEALVDGITPPPLLKRFRRGVFGDANERELKRIQPLVARINDLEPAWSKLTDDELRAKTPHFKERLAKGETLDDLLPEAFAAVREAGKRRMGMRHYDVPADRRHRAPSGQDRRDEDRRRQDAGRHAARLPQRLWRARASTSSPSTTTSPSATPTG
jgi:hypothetical protein